MCPWCIICINPTLLWCGIGKDVNPMDIMETCLLYQLILGPWHGWCHNFWAPTFWQRWHVRNYSNNDKKRAASIIFVIPIIGIGGVRVTSPPPIRPSGMSKAISTRNVTWSVGIYKALAYPWFTLLLDVYQIHRKVVTTPPLKGPMHTYCITVCTPL